MSTHAAYRTFLLLTATRWFPVGMVVALLGLWKLERGLSVAQVLTAGAISGLMILLLELPTSGFADTFGRRPLLLAAAVVGVASSLVFVLASTFWVFVVAAVLQGIHRALDSGPLEAWYVDTVHAARPGADVDQELSRAGAVLGTSVAAGAVISGLLVWWDPLPGSALRLPMVLWTLLGMVHLLALLLLLREPPRADAGVSPWQGLREVRSVVVGGVALARHNRVLLALLGAEATMSLLMTGFEQLVPLRLAELVGGPERAGALMGPTAAAGWALFAVGAALGGRLSRRLGLARAATLTHLLTGIGVIGIGLAIGPVGVVTGYVVAYGVFGGTGPLHAALVHREANAENRATVLSLGSMASFAVFAAVAPMAGVLAGATSLVTALVVLGSAGALGCLCYRPAARTDSRPRGAGAAVAPDPPPATTARPAREQTPGGLG